jgi:MFS family permease
VPFRDYPPEARTLLGAQLVFNLGFYAVVPFLAGAMQTEYGLGTAAIGLVLGARTFSQQGMFLFGGVLADRWGARRSILTGCLIRILGYVILAVAADFTLFLLGAVLTGAGGALFSPALEAQLSQADRPADSEESGGRKRGRRSVFVWLAVTGEIGAVLGPVLGSALWGWGFDAALTAGIGVFAAVTVLLWCRLPAPPASVPQQPHPSPVRTAPAVGRPALGCLRNRRFVAFCVLASTNLLAYNQLYFAIPIELSRRGLDPAWLGGLFLLASALTLLLQLPVSAVGRRLGARPSLSAGFAVLAAAFTVAAVTSVHAGAVGGPVLPVMGTVAVLILGRMLLTPTILSLVPDFVPDTRAGTGRGAYYGLVATCGGVAVLAGNAVMGQLVDLTDRHLWWPGAPWVPLILLALLAAVTLPRVLPGNRMDSLSGQTSTAASSEKTT